MQRFGVRTPGWYDQLPGRRLEARPMILRHGCDACRGMGTSGQGGGINMSVLICGGFSKLAPKR
jgi:hypothetical protein